MNNREKVLELHKKSYLENSDTIYGFFEDYRFLSNYHLVDIEHEGRVYPSTENAYQVSKLKMSQTKIKTIFSKINPAESKFLGNKLPIREDWENVKYNIMYELVYKKFNEDENYLLGVALLATGNKNLVELNWWNDSYWGMILREDNTLFGQNNLGKVLMDVRRMIQNKRNNI